MTTTHKPNTILTMAALDYTKAGLHVIALTGKKPNGRVHGESWSYEDSFHGEVSTPEEMAALDWAFSHDAGTTGIAILIPPDFYVADVDTEEAAHLLVEMGFESHGDTVAAQTKNGLHIWFWYPGADRNRWAGGRTLLFKGLGGYVVAPPSLHYGADGEPDGQYLWGASPLVVGGRLQFPDILPPGVAKVFEAEDQFTNAAPPKEAMAHFNMVPDDGPWWLWKTEWTYAMEGLEKAIINAADGNQNNVIHWAAMTAREEGVPYDVAMTRLLDAAIKGGHPRSRARDTIKGAYKRAPRDAGR